jgi:hypothetical protein
MRCDTVVNCQSGLSGWPGKARSCLAQTGARQINQASPVLMWIKSQKHIKTIYTYKARSRHLQVGPARRISLDLVNSPYKEVVCMNYYISWYFIKNLVNINNTTLHVNHKNLPPMQPILRPVDTVLNFGIRNMFTMLGLPLFTQAEHGYISYRYQFYLCHATRLILLSQCQTIVHVQGPCVLTQLVAALFPWVPDELNRLALDRVK